MSSGFSLHVLECIFFAVSEVVWEGEEELKKANGTTTDKPNDDRAADATSRFLLLWVLFILCSDILHDLPSDRSSRWYSFRFIPAYGELSQTDL